MTAKKQEQLCLLSIGYQMYVLPLDAGVSAMRLLAKALRVDTDFSGDALRYIAQSQAELEMKIISSADIDMPNAKHVPTRGAKQLLLGQS